MAVDGYSLEAIADNQVCSVMEIADYLQVGVVFKSTLDERKKRFPLGPTLYSVCSTKFSRKRQNVLRAGGYWDLEIEDLYWPTICPVLYTPLLWENPHNRQQDMSPCFRKIQQDLDFVTGNVEIVSCLAEKLLRFSEEELQFAYYHKRGF